MQDKNGKLLDLGMIVSIINQPDLFDSHGWILIDFIEMGVHTYYFLQHCVTQEIRLFESKDIERG